MSGEGKWRQRSTANVYRATISLMHHVVSDIEAGRDGSVRLSQLLNELDGYPAESVKQMAIVLRTVFNHAPGTEEPIFRGSLFYRFRRKPPMAVAPPTDYHWLQLFHPDGFVREKTLNALDAVPDSAFRLAALVLRLNDWVPAVRLAAQKALDRLAPLVGIEIIVTSLHFLTAHLLDRASSAVDLSSIDRMLRRPDVHLQLQDRLMHDEEGNLGKLTRLLLRTNLIDEKLPALTGARNYLVRARALKTLIDGEAEFIVGRETTVVAGYSGRYLHREPIVEKRKIDIPVDRAALITTAARDPASTVRKVAADGLIRHRHTIADIDTVIAAFERETNAAIRERIDFVKRHKRDPA